MKLWADARTHSNTQRMCVDLNEYACVKCSKFSRKGSNIHHMKYTITSAPPHTFTSVKCIDVIDRTARAYSHSCKNRRENNNASVHKFTVYGLRRNGFLIASAGCMYACVCKTYKNIYTTIVCSALYIRSILLHTPFNTFVRSWNRSLFSLLFWFCWTKQKCLFFCWFSILESNCVWHSFQLIFNWKPNSNNRLFRAN